MKKILTLCLALTVIAGVLAGCGKSSAPQRTPEELTQIYTQAITAHGGEMVEYNPVVSSGEEAALIMEMMFGGLTAEDVEACAMSVSMMNVKAYGIAAIKPAEGREEAVKAGMQQFIDTQKANFERYLEDQLKVAEAAKLEALADGTILLVMNEGQDEIFAAIKAEIEG